MAQLRADARSEFLHVHRLDEILQRACIQPGDAGVQVRARGHQDGRNSLGRQSRDQAQAVFTRQADIDHHQICPIAQQPHVEVFGRLGPPGTETGTLKIAAHVGADVIVVFYDGDSGFRGHRTKGCARGELWKHLNTGYSRCAPSSHPCTTTHNYSQNTAVFALCATFKPLEALQCTAFA